MKFINLLLIPSLALFIGACQTNGLEGPTAHRLGWKSDGPAAPLSAWTKALPRDAKALAETGAEGMVRNAVALSKQKRFLEARAQLAALREDQNPNSQGFRSLTAAMAIINLKSGDVAGFKRLARKIDSGKVRVDPAYADIICLSRFIEGKKLPVNCPSRLSSYLQSLPRPDAKTAQAR